MIFPSQPTTVTTFHLIANPQHITIVSEGVGMAAVWETSQTDVHTYYGTAPFVQYCHCLSSVTGQDNIIVPTAYSTALTGSYYSVVFNVTNPSNSTNYGTYDVSLTNSSNIGSLVQSNSTMRVNTINSSGFPQYAITPVYFTASAIGYPTQFVTGVVPVYWVSGNLGNTGDTVSIKGDNYTFFNAGTNFSLLMKTS